ncbi:hypothetical protein OSTOST_25915 [Ostertagia ostertagi]
MKEELMCETIRCCGLLDFSCTSPKQRRSRPKLIRTTMASESNTAEPYQLALDNPSVTLLGFMSQRYGLTKPVWQNTNFVVFEELFKSVTPNGSGRLNIHRKVGVDLRHLVELAPVPLKLAGLDHAISGHSAKTREGASAKGRERHSSERTAQRKREASNNSTLGPSHVVEVPKARPDRPVFHSSHRRSSLILLRSRATWDLCALALISQ